MKNKFLLIALLALLIHACKRNELTENPASAPFARKTMVIGDSVTQINCGSYSFLKFDDKDVFINTMKLLADSTTTSDSALNDFEANFTFTSLRTATNTSLHGRHSSGISLLMATALSHDTIVQIDSLAFLFDFDDSTVYELYPVTCSNLSLLKQKQEVNIEEMYIFRYKTYQPVLHPSGYEEYTGKSFRWLRKLFNGCDDAWAKGDNDKEPVEYTSTVNGTQKRFKAELSHAYFNQAVYFEISHYFSHIDMSTGYSKNVSVALSHQDGWKEYCGKWGSNANWPNSTFGNNSFIGVRPYQSSNSLAINHNQVKTYVWFIPFGANPNISSPKSIGSPALRDLNF